MPLTAGGGSPRQHPIETEQGAQAPEADGNGAPASLCSLQCTAGLSIDWDAIDAVARGYQVSALLCLSVPQHQAGLLYPT